MKKVILWSFALLALISTHVNAQTETPGEKPIKVGNQWRMPKDAILRSRAFAQKLQKSLNLDQPTTKKVFNAYMGNAKSVDEIRMGKGSEKEKKDAMGANQHAFDESLKTILSPEQFSKYIKSKT